MKLAKITLTATSLLLLLTGCTSADVEGSSPEPTEKTESVVAKEVENVSSEAESESESAGKSAQQLLDEMNERNSQFEDKPSEGTGVRSDPFDFSYEPVISGKTTGSNGGDIEISMLISLMQPIRGQEAMDFIMSENQFNEPAPEGWEWLVFRLFTRLDEGSEDEAYSPMFDFSSVKSNGSPSPTGHYVSFSASNDEYGYPELYKGGYKEGYMAVLIPEDDPDSTIKMTVDWGVEAFFKLPE